MINQSKFNYLKKEELKNTQIFKKFKIPKYFKEGQHVL
jgi:hypothetical protein